jgi:predicted methyltransferase
MRPVASPSPSRPSPARQCVRGGARHTLQLPRALLLLALAGCLAGCGGDAADAVDPASPEAIAQAAQVAAEESRRAVAAAVAEPSRPAADRARDAQEKPVEVLSFLGVGPGMKVLQLFADDGYVTELLSHAVGPQGVVYVTRLEDATRAARLGNVKLVQDANREVPTDSIDRVLIVAGYHQAVNMDIDRTVLLGGTIAALKAGGVLGIVDHSAQPGSRGRDVGTLHRIDQAFVVEEVRALGFLPVGQLDVLRNRGDNRTLMHTDEAIIGRTDRFVLKFVRPAGLKPPMVEIVEEKHELIEPGMPGGIDGTSGSAAVQEVVEDVRGRIDAYGDAVTAGQRPVEEPPAYEVPAEPSG